MSVGRSRFNPTLVRLRHALPGAESGNGGGFQSHAGSIEAARIPCQYPLAGPFQSHAGSIEAGFFFRRAGLAGAVSIPRWFD